MKRRSFVRIAVAGVAALALAAAAVGLAAARRSAVASARSVQPFVHAKGSLLEIAAGKNAEAAIGANEVRNPDSTPDIEAYLQRAYPAAEITMDQTIAAQNAWAALAAGAGSPGTWQLIGPSTAKVPAVLNVLGDNADYVTAGRVTAMAIGPSCQHGACPVYVGAAGGGIWRTPDGLAGSPQWQFVSGSFATNAIGSLVVDPTDPTGQTIYAGTGEPNVSSDSEAGMGVYRSTDGGATWALLSGSSQFQGRAASSIAVAPDGSILVGIARAVRGISETDGGATSSPPIAVAFGVYKSTDGGATFVNVTGAEGSARGVNEVRVDPNSGSVYYASFLGAGVWRSSNAGATWTQIKNPLNTPNNANNTDRSEFALANVGGTTRMYVGQGASGGPQARFYRTNNAQTATNASFVDMTTAQNINYCEGQCWYDNVVYSPAGNPDVVYLMGSFDYAQDHGPSNARAVLLSTDGGATWSDLTQDSSPQHADFTHPDQHAIVTNPGNPFQYWEGSDGGVVRSDGTFGDVSYKCDQRGLNASADAYCKSLLFRVPGQLSQVNKDFSTLQFQSLSTSSKRPGNNLMGGTQDNGTWQLTGSNVVASQIMYGDGGQSGFSSADDGLRFNTFTGQANDVNFRKGDPTKWVVATGVILSSPEGSYFYPPIVADPNPANGGTIFQGSFSVWRTQDWAGNRDFLEANCSEFTTSAANPACGDFVRIGPPGATDLTSAAYGGSRRGGAVSAIRRSPDPGNTGTVWVSTGAGRVFISDNSDAPASSVVWTRIDNTSTSSPGRFPAAIAVDAANPHHAWIVYSGYNQNTPAQPGHVFDVTWNGATATFVSLDGTSFPNLPANGVAHDDVNGDLYVSTDFGVLRLANASTTWTVAGSGLPMVEVPALTIIPSARLLYAATHGRSAWVLQLP
ncbi:MAG TPA: exo-alpha-sialidase [Thermoanaerobaculia bacterium]|nr:exo-alpha-sialidase [Thermoanaerobaculia bacterium]